MSSHMSIEDWELALETKINIIMQNLPKKI